MKKDVHANHKSHTFKTDKNQIVHNLKKNFF